MALAWRDAFAREVYPKLVRAPPSRSRFNSETKHVSLDLRDAKLVRADMLGIFEETFKASSVELSSTTDDNSYVMADMLSKWFEALHKGSEHSDSEQWDRAVCRTAMLAVSAQLSLQKDLSSVQGFLKRHTASGEDQMWTAHHYNEEFEKIPELEELTNTPFMVQVRRNQNEQRLGDVIWWMSNFDPVDDGLPVLLHSISRWI